MAVDERRHEELAPRVDDVVACRALAATFFARHCKGWLAQSNAQPSPRTRKDPDFLSFGGTMNTYIFELKQQNITKEEIIRAADLQGAMQEIDPKVEEGWSIVSVSENGTRLQEK